MQVLMAGGLRSEDDLEALLQQEIDRREAVELNLQNQINDISRRMGENHGTVLLYRLFYQWPN